MKNTPDVPLDPFVQSFCLGNGAFPAGKIVVEDFNFLLLKVCDPEKVRNMMYFLISLPVMNRRV